VKKKKESYLCCLKVGLEGGCEREPIYSLDKEMTMRTLWEYINLLVEEEVVSSKSKKAKGQGVIPPEAPRDALFGSYAFAPTRKDIPSPKEPNTPEEEEAREAIVQYIVNNDKGPLNAKALELLKLHQQGYYQKVLDPGKYKQVFRFIRMNRNEFASLVGQDVKSLRTYGVLPGGVLKPHDGQISGWTVSVKLFTKEGFDGYGDGDVAALFVAPVAGNKFLGNPGVLARSVGEPMYANEMETIAVGPVNYEKCSYALLSEDEEFDDGLLRVKISRMIRNAGVK